MNTTSVHEESQMMSSANYSSNIERIEEQNSSTYSNFDTSNIQTENVNETRSSTIDESSQGQQINTSDFKYVIYSDKPQKIDVYDVNQQLQGSQQVFSTDYNVNESTNVVNKDVFYDSTEVTKDSMR